MKYSFFKGIRKNIKEKNYGKESNCDGATSGIGMKVASLLAQRGWQVGIAGRRIERLEEVKGNTNQIISQKTKDSQKGSISEGVKASRQKSSCYQQIDVTSPEAHFPTSRSSSKNSVGWIYISIVRESDGKTIL